MATSISYEQGYTGFSPKIPRVVTSSTLAQVTAAGWWNNNPISGEVALNSQDLVCVCYSYGVAGSQGTALFNVSIGSNGIVTLSLAYDSEIGPQVVSTSVASATPGTVRSITGKISDSVLMTSGNIVGVRGEADPFGASGGFIYGAQGKVIGGAHTYSGSVWVAGVFGQLDISASTVNAAQMAPIWGDYGTSSGTLTSQTGLYGIAMTNTTAAVLAGQIYLYGGAQNLLLLSTNAGLSGVTYFINAGTGSGSWGNATPPTPSKVLRISVDGTQYYLPLVAQNT